MTSLLFMYVDNIEDNNNNDKKKMNNLAEAKVTSKHFQQLVNNTLRKCRKTYRSKYPELGIRTFVITVYQHD